MNRIRLAALCLLLCCGPVWAAEYGRHDLRSILTVSETPSGKAHGLGLQALNRILEDLARHALMFTAGSLSEHRREMMRFAMLTASTGLE